MDKPDEELKRELKRVAKEMAELDWDAIEQRMLENAAARAAKQKPVNGNGHHDADYRS